MKEMCRPARLSAGDTIGIIAPASCGEYEKIVEAARFFEQKGLRIRYGEAIAKRHGYLAGTDRERIDDLQRMFADPEVKAIFCARGGYGTGRIAAELDYELIAQNPKIFWGYSDITFLHVALQQKAGLVTFHGPMLTSDIAVEQPDPLTLQTFEQLFAPQPLCYDESISPLQTLVEGEAEGTIIGGNLCLLVSTLGTEFEIDTKGKLLLIEEVDEEPYRIDRMLNQLKMAGKFADAAGILLCDFSNCGPMKRQESLTLEQVFADHVVPAGKPTLLGFRIGHCSPNLAVPFGVKARLSTTNKSLTIEEAGVL
ncbi:S66 peptidase family protein [Brevibacillus fulvus]|uniref:Muramoyltetrapeptide carboxypeptidase n=1 Tax=Brevibacillus fulvus TaxID=1125967 RepID=A0A938XWL7_9BACL|nr:LD-carboxypeptidase [Brevibacillus fulvus]MBM7589256.1 muramoyltetrapeptide carboxypeptidase [Brevibacillus fulvus]